MKKVEMFSIVCFVVVTVVILVMRVVNGGADYIQSREFSISGIKNGIAITSGEEVGGIFISVPNGIDPESVISVSSDPNIAYLLLKKDNDNRIINAEIIAVSEGIAEMYVRSGEGDIISEKFTVNVIKDENSTTVGADTEAVITSADLPDGVAVYVTASGTKYHLSSKCAGDSATARSLEDAVDEGYLPCKNCSMIK